jgi:hypothetical protein
VQQTINLTQSSVKTSAFLDETRAFDILSIVLQPVNLIDAGWLTPKKTE